MKKGREINKDQYKEISSFGGKGGGRTAEKKRQVSEKGRERGEEERKTDDLYMG